MYEDKRKLTILDIKALRYIKKNKKVKKDVLNKKFGELRLEMLSRHTMSSPSLVTEILERSEKPNPFPPPHNDVPLMEGIGLYELTPEGSKALIDYNMEKRQEKIKFYIPIVISALALIISIVSLLVK